ncbi:MAG: pyridoxal phosphate-dependent aminotransferase [Eubacterium sp.]|nr:pyridoxal phosphate-dependent aminotransferase [Candidatus Colimonas fimequi]
MINKRYEKMLSEKDLIFEISYYAKARAEVVGAENVHNFSLGGPSVDPPQSVSDTIKKLVDEVPSKELHAYSPGVGLPQVRQQIADNLNERFGSNYGPGNIFMTIGASGALAHAFRAVAEPGDEIMVFAPYFSEYKPYTEGAGLKLNIVPANTENFQINFEAMEAQMNEKVTVVMVNSPNNPSGIVYNTETIKRLAQILEEKSAEYGHPIYLISDEPYRELLFAGTDAPFIANYYKNTLVCYSFSKSITLPGGRIGYLAINPDADNADLIFEICPQISRTIGMNGPTGLMQRLVGEVCGDTADLSVYEENRNILCEALKEYGYELTEPGGTFYMFPKALEEDSMAFCENAKELDLMLVPGDIFGCPGFFRLAYCVPTERVKAALPALKKLAEAYGRI